MVIDQYIEDAIKEIHEALGRSVCDDGVVLIGADYETEKNNTLAGANGRVLLHYHDDLAKVLTERR